MQLGREHIDRQDWYWLTVSKALREQAIRGELVRADHSSYCSKRYSFFF